MQKPRVVVICSPDHYLLRGLQPIRHEAEFFVSDRKETVEEQARDADIIINSGLTGKAVPLSEVWPVAKRVRWVHSLSAGVESVLFPELIESHVVLTNARGVFKRPLAEFTVLGMLYFYKQVRRLIESQRAHHWDSFSVNWLPGKVMGIVGYGEIGRECALLAKPLGVKIHALRRRPELLKDDPIVDRAFSPDQLTEMLAGLDFLVAAAPLTPQTRHMLSEPEFRSMKTSAIVMNVGRGPVIDESALIKALREQWIAGAALDVFEEEPLPAEHPFFDMDNVLISPHCTDRTSDPDWLDLSVAKFVENFHHYVKGEALTNVVDKKAGY